jgi:cyclohexa-1,5-dienecarbonyl-CoA hydratase
MPDSEDSLIEKPKNIICKEKDGMFQIFLNRPPSNAFSAEMVEEINRTLSDLLYRTDLKLVIFLAAGKNFCGGLSPEDVSEDDRSYQLIEALGRMYEQMQNLNIPLLSVVQGLTLGAGFELAIYSDLCIAAESAKFGFPEIRMGLFPAIACNILPRYISPKRAAELIFTGDLISAREAEKYGLVNSVVPDEKLSEQAGLMVGKLLQFSAPVLQLTKKAMIESQAKPVDIAIQSVESIYLNELLGLDDAQEGIKAFMEKRKPVWKNQ